MLSSAEEKTSKKRLRQKSAEVEGSAPSTKRKGESRRNEQQSSPSTRPPARPRSAAAITAERQKNNARAVHDDSSSEEGEEGNGEEPDPGLSQELNDYDLDELANEENGFDPDEKEEATDAPSWKPKPKVMPTPSHIFLDRTQAGFEQYQWSDQFPDFWDEIRKSKAVSPEEDEIYFESVRKEIEKYNLARHNAGLPQIPAKDWARGNHSHLSPGQLQGLYAPENGRAYLPAEDGTDENIVSNLDCLTENIVRGKGAVSERSVMQDCMPMKNEYVFRPCPRGKFTQKEFRRPPQLTEVPDAKKRTVERLVERFTMRKPTITIATGEPAGIVVRESIELARAALVKAGEDCVVVTGRTTVDLPDDLEERRIPKGGKASCETIIILRDGKITHVIWFICHICYAWCFCGIYVVFAKNFIADGAMNAFSSLLNPEHVIPEEFLAPLSMKAMPSHVSSPRKTAYGSMAAHLQEKIYIVMNSQGKIKESLDLLNGNARDDLQNAGICLADYKGEDVLRRAISLWLKDFWGKRTPEYMAEHSRKCIKWDDSLSDEQNRKNHGARTNKWQEGLTPEEIYRKHFGSAEEWSIKMKAVHARRSPSSVAEGVARQRVGLSKNQAGNYRMQINAYVDKKQKKIEAQGNNNRILKDTLLGLLKKEKPDLYSQILRDDRAVRDRWTSDGVYWTW